MSGDGDSVEVRLDKCRLLSRTAPDALQIIKQCDKLLRSAHLGNLSQAVVAVQELARDHIPVIVALKWVVILVDLLESEHGDLRVAACNALAAISIMQEGRDAIRTAGGLRPLVMVLGEGSRSAMTTAACLTLMNCSACDTCKEAIAECRGVPQLLGLLRETSSRCAASGGRASLRGIDAASPVAGQAATPRAALTDLSSPGDCKAAVYASGALMNMAGVSSVINIMMEAGAVPVFEEVLRVSVPGDTVATRASFILSWLSVGQEELDQLIAGQPAGQPASQAPSTRPPLTQAPTPPPKRLAASISSLMTPRGSTPGSSVSGYASRPVGRSSASGVLPQARTSATGRLSGTGAVGSGAAAAAAAAVAAAKRMSAAGEGRTTPRSSAAPPPGSVSSSGRLAA